MTAMEVDVDQLEPVASTSYMACPSMNILRQTLSKSPNLSKYSYQYERIALKGAYAETLDRVNVLGNDEGYGHTGCAARSSCHERYQSLRLC